MDRKQSLISTGETNVIKLEIMMNDSKISPKSIYLKHNLLLEFPLNMPSLKHNFTGNHLSFFLFEDATFVNCTIPINAVKIR